VDANTLSVDNFVGVDNLLPEKAGKTTARYAPNTAKLSAYRSGDILLGNIRPYLKKVWLASSSGGCSGDVLAIRINDNYRQRLQPEFLYYILSSDDFFAYNMKHSKGAKMPRGDKASLLNYNIPVPPIEVQKEIVKILDKFTQLEAELKAELEARRKQYEYHSSQLLTFSDEGGVRWTTLGEVGKISMCKRIMKNQTASVGDVPFYKIGTFGKKPNAFISRDVYEAYKSKYSYPKVGDILLSASGTIGRRVIFDGQPAYFQDSNIIWLANDESMITNKFLYYVYETINWQTEGGTIQRLYNDNMARQKVPVPPRDEQDRIVSILDKFDTLVNDISVGLPAEIAARRKQYEYYRTKLLTFQELPS
jgi:type I restriction enzyme S subunit